jgi:hypothetical protein
MRRAQAQLAASVHSIPLGRDTRVMQTKAGIERAVVDVLRRLGFLPGAPKPAPPLRMKEAKD